MSEASLVEAAAQSVSWRRRLLFGILLMSQLGLLLELLLLEHTEGFWQKVPLVLLSAGVVTTILHGLLRRRWSRWTFSIVMAAFLIGGGIGVAQHYDGNREFELEMSPELGGWELFKEAIQGATPALAPSALAQIGLIGLVLSGWRSASKR